MNAEMTEKQSLGQPYTMFGPGENFAAERVSIDRAPGGGPGGSRPTRRGWKTRVYLVARGGLEWLLALILLLLTSPVVLVLAALVKLTSPGPAFYSQTRLGLNGKQFKIFKLRTMGHNCEAHSGPQWSRNGDTRVTPLGKILRETHLDELPQLFNVLLGHMSIVGPRPERPEFADRLARALPNYMERLRVRPGITGLAQVNLPPDADIEDVRRKLAFDLYYVDRIGLILDARIFVCTVFQFMAQGASACCRMLVGKYGEAVERSFGKVLKPEGRQAVHAE
jgi:lipopolysaccharide/colanic/teichoic acid biosynthesis glycosyltransferase